MELESFTPIFQPWDARSQYGIAISGTATGLLYTRRFLAHLEGQTDAVAGLARMAGRSPSCLICFEADFNRCHRTYVARAAAKLAGLRVIHLTDQTEIPDGAARSAA
jgi:3,4-dihydroxy-2-butanone 4-phosphate synthase